MTKKKFIKTLFLGLTILATTNVMAGSGNWNGRGLSNGLVVSFCGSNGKFLSSENGVKTMRANRNSVGAWELFTVVTVDATQNTVKLRASNGLYVKRVGGDRLRANATLAGASVFVSNDNATNPGQHSLSFNGKFLSSENGAIPVTVNRNALGLWELWDVSVPF